MNETSIPLDGTIAAAETPAGNHWARDGLTELAVGALLMLGGGLLVVVVRTTPGSSALSMPIMALMLLLPIGVVFVRLGVPRLRERITYPRTGYGGFAASERANGRATTVIAFLICVALGELLFRVPSSLGVRPALYGMYGGAYFLFMGYRHRLPRFYAVAAASLAVGLAAAFSGLHGRVGLGAYVGIFGLVLATSGATTLVRYLRRTTTNPAGWR